jgi:hypothetical protein
MRDPKRIDVDLNRIKKIWKRYPDLRLGQLIGNVISSEYLYYIEDSDLVSAIEKHYDSVPDPGNKK